MVIYKGSPAGLSPCYKCTDRTPGCHGNCEPFKAWKAKLEAIREAYFDDTIGTFNENPVTRKLARRRWNDKRKK